ncbi:hypothetical protein GT347_23320 [Xylophilus rhododendri]|uniref:Uncharacterized protein n=1 Tax=Xylophilus rhododendri TaxID=2697032 RepID=A0A857JDA8_9BURK|nr:hypothetical protein [Xylophilus rhododendri]QHJ00656.1 hypothetical protein GT347_23320 [Xylophilus rhododendri]
MPSRTLGTMLRIYRRKYRIEVATVVFWSIRPTAERMRRWCDSLPPGGHAVALAATHSGLHTLALVLLRSGEGVSSCLMVDSAGACLGTVIRRLAEQFDDRVYVTPRIQRGDEHGCMYFALRFVLMTRCPDLGERVRRTLRANDARHVGACPGARQLELEDMAPLAGWVAATRLRSELQGLDEVCGQRLDNGGSHAGWTVDQFLDRRPDRIALNVRTMYDEVDRLVHEPRACLLSDASVAYLRHRFLRHLEPGNA